MLMHNVNNLVITSLVSLGMSVAPCRPLHILVVMLVTMHKLDASS